VTVSSRKGFGPLASRSTRLAQKLSYTGPGPGKTVTLYMKTVKKLPSIAWSTSRCICCCAAQAAVCAELCCGNTEAKACHDLVDQRTSLSPAPGQDCWPTTTCTGLLAGSYSPAEPSRRHPASEAGSAAFCTTGRSFSASGSTTSSSSSPAPGPGAHGVPRLAHTGTDLAWASPAKPGAAPAFKAPPRSTSASATLLREQLQQQKYHDGRPVPWLLAPPQTTGGRPCPGPRLLHSAHPSTRRALQDMPQHAATRATLGTRSALQQHCGTQALGQVLQPLTRICGSSARQDSRAVPGPGSYDLYKYGAMQESAQTHRSAFIRPLVQDRFGASNLRRPAQQQQSQEVRQQSTTQLQDRGHNQQSAHSGVHEQHPAGACRHGRLSCPVSSRQPGVSVGFRSRSPGHSEALLAAADVSMVGAPGPSCYNPQAPPHKVSYWQTRSARTFVAAV
jgi:hypothetical protein